MAYNVDDFNRILADINAKIDTLTSDSDEKTMLIESMKNAFDNKNNNENERLEEFAKDLNSVKLLLENSQKEKNYDELFDALRNLEYSFKNEIMNINFDKNNMLEIIKEDVVKLFEKSTYLDEIFPAKNGIDIEDIKSSISEKLNQVQNDINGHIKNDFESLAQAIGALYGAVDKFKKDISANGFGDTKNISEDVRVLNENTAVVSAKIDELMNVISTEAAGSEEILDVLRQTKDKTNEIAQNLVGDMNSYIEDLKMDMALISEKMDTFKDELQENSVTNLSQILSKIQDSSKLISEFKEGLSSHITEYLDLIKNALETFVDEMKSSQDSMGEELASKIDEFQQISKDLNRLESVMDEREDNYKEVVESKVLELQSSLNNVQNLISSSNAGIDTSLSQKIAGLSELISQNSLKKDEKLESLEKTLNDYSYSLSNYFNELGANIKTFDEKLTSKVDVVSDIVNNVSAKTDEITLNIRTNLSNQIGDLKTDIAIVADRVDLIKDEMKQTSNNNLSQIMTGISSSTGSLGEFRDNVSDHLSEYLTAIKDALETFSEDLLTAQENLGSEIMENKVEEFKKISYDINKLDIALVDKEAEYKSYIDEKIEELHNYLLSLETVFSSSNVGAENSILAKIAALDEIIKDNDVVNAKKLDDLNHTLNNYFISTNSNFTKMDLGLSSVNENFNSKVQRISEMLDNVSEKNSIYKNETIEKISEISGLISEIKTTLGCTDNGEFKKLIDKLSCIESGLDDNFASYDSNLVSLHGKLGEYIKSIEQISSDTNKKLESSALETVMIRKELSEIREEINSFVSGEISDFDKHFDEVLHKFNDIIDNIEVFKSELNENIKTSIAENIDFVDKGLEYLSQSLNEIKAKNMDSGDVLSTDYFENKISVLKDELSLINTDLVQAVNKKCELLIDSFSPVKDVCEKFVSFSFSEIIEEVKNQIQLSYLNLLSELNDNLTDNHDAYLKVENIYKDIVSKCECLGESVSGAYADNLELINSTIAGIDLTVKANLDKTNSIYDEWQDSLEELNLKFIQNHKEYEHSLVDMLEQIDKIFDEKLLRNQEDLNEILSKLFKNNDFVELIENSSKENALMLEELKQQMQEGFESNNLNHELIDGIKKVVHESIDILNDKFLMIEHKIDTINTDDTAAILDEVRASSDKVENLLEMLDTKIDDLAKIDDYENETFDDEFHDSILADFDGIKQSIKELNAKVDVIAMSDESDFNEESVELSQKMLESLTALHNKLDIIAVSSDNNEIITELSDKIAYAVDELGSKLEKIKSENASELKNDIKDYSDKIIDSVAELHSKVDVIAMTDNSLLDEEIAQYSEKIMNSVSKLYSKIEEITANSNSHVKDEIFSYTEKIMSSMSELNLKVDVLAMDDKSKNASELKNDIKGYSDKILDSVAELHSKVDVIAMTDNSLLDEEIAQYSEKIMNSVSKLYSKIEEITANSDSHLKDEISSYMGKIMSSMSELNLKVDVLAMDDKSEMHDIIYDSSEKLLNTINELNKKVDILAQDDNSEILDEIDEIKDLIISQQKLLESTDTGNVSAKLEDIIQSLDYSDDKIAKTLELLHNKVDILAMTDDNEIKEEIQDIRNLIVQQQKAFENDSDDEKSQEISNHLQKLIGEINKIEKNVSEIDLEKNSQDIKDSVMTAMLSAMDQVSFVEETEEIKDFVEEKTDAINQTLLDVKKQISNISNTGDDMDFYSYTLQDVESDLAKLRLSLNELSSSTSSSNEFGVISANISRMAKSIEQLQINYSADSLPEFRTLFNKLSEDILSLSVRTNKILLDSDESQKVMNTSLKDFAEKTQNLQERLDEIDNKKIDSRLSLIEEKIDESVSTSKILQNVMIYLGEWMDGTSETISSIYDKSVKAASTHDLLESLKLAAPNQTDLLKVVENRFEEQQSRIDRLEQKLEKALDILSDFDENIIAAKIERMDKRLGKLTENIEKLTAYVDEE